MKFIARTAAILAVVALAGCAGGASTGAPTGAASAWKISDSSVRFGPDIARTASGTEYTSNFVWDGYNDGNRKKQVVGLFKSAIGDVASGMSGGQDVRVKVVVTTFHALTNSASVWCCGEHNIVADLEVVDAGSGSTLAKGDGIYLGRVALGGVPGLVAQAAGRDQTVRVREGIANGIRNWLSGL